MSTWKEEQAAATALLLDTLAGVAGELDGDWTVETPHQHTARMVSPDGVVIYARIETYGAKSGRLTLSAGTPEGANYSAGDYGRDKCPEITVSPDRGAVAIARDMSRRLIPQAVEYWQAVESRMANRHAAANAREVLATELAKIMGSGAREFRGDWSADTPGVLRGADDYVYGDFTPNYDGKSVKVELRGLTPDQAREVARLVQSWANAARS